MSPVDTVLSQFLCCSTRYKGGNDLRSRDDGLFPFREGSPSVFHEVPRPRSDSVLASTMSGRNIALNALDEVVFFSFSESTEKLPMQLVLAGRSSPPEGFSEFIPYVQITEQPVRACVVANSTADEGSCMFVFSPTGSECGRVKIPPGSGKVTCATGMSVSGSIVGTENGSLFQLALSDKEANRLGKVEGRIEALASDAKLIFVSDSRSSIQVFSLPKMESISVIDLSEFVDSPLTSLVRPGARIASRNGNFGGSLFFAAGHTMGQVALDTKQVLVESLSAENKTIKTVFFGPFDNGPIMSFTSDNEIQTWETGYCLRVASRIAGKGRIVSAAVAASRLAPRVFVAAESLDGAFSITPFDLKVTRNEKLSS